MNKKIETSGRRRSREVTKPNIKTKVKRNKTAMFLAIIIVFMFVFSSLYVIFSNLGNNNSNNSDNSYKDDPEYKTALAGTTYPVAVFETSKGIIAVELYDNRAPETCQNFINLVNDGFYDGMIFHRVMDDFMIQAGKSFPDGSTKTSPYGNIGDFEGGVSHVNGAISMASTGAGVPGSAEFFICDGDQTFLDGSYAAFGKTIYGIKVVQDIADEPQDGSYGSVGGGKPYNNIIIQKIYIAKE